jgi:hypothetical protein
MPTNSLTLAAMAISGRQRFLSLDEAVATEPFG